MVYFVLAVETAQSVLFLDSVFYSLARGFGNMAALDRIGTIWFSVPFIDGLGAYQIVSGLSYLRANVLTESRLLKYLVAWIVQSFYGYRVYVLSRSKVLAMVIWFVCRRPYISSLIVR